MIALPANEGTTTWISSSRTPTTDRVLPANTIYRRKCQYWYVKDLFTSTQNLKNFQDFLSHRIFRRMHGVLNINENKI